MKALRKSAMHSPALLALRYLIAKEVVGSNDGSQLGLLLESAQVISHPMPIAQVGASGRCILLQVKIRWLLVQEEDVSMRRTGRRWRWANVVGDKGCARVGQCGFTIGSLLGLEAGLDPVQDGTQNGEGWVGAIKIQTDNDIRFIWSCRIESDFWRCLGI